MTLPLTLPINAGKNDPVVQSTLGVRIVLRDAASPVPANNPIGLYNVSGDNSEFRWAGYDHTDSTGKVWRGDMLVQGGVSEIRESSDLRRTSEFTKIGAFECIVSNVEQLWKTLDDDDIGLYRLLIESYDLFGDTDGTDNRTETVFFTGYITGVQWGVTSFTISAESVISSRFYNLSRTSEVSGKFIPVSFGELEFTKAVSDDIKETVASFKTPPGASTPEITDLPVKSMITGGFLGFYYYLIERSLWETPSSNNNVTRLSTINSNYSDYHIYVVSQGDDVRLLLNADDTYVTDGSENVGQYRRLADQITAFEGSGELLDSNAVSGDYVLSLTDADNYFSKGMEVYIRDSGGSGTGFDEEEGPIVVSEANSTQLILATPISGNYEVARGAAVRRRQYLIITEEATPRPLGKDLGDVVEASGDTGTDTSPASSAVIRIVKIEGSYRSDDWPAGGIDGVTDPGIYKILQSSEYKELPSEFISSVSNGNALNLYSAGLKNSLSKVQSYTRVEADWSGPFSDSDIVQFAPGGADLPRYYAVRRLNTSTGPDVDKMFGAYTSQSLLYPNNNGGSYSASPSSGIIDYDFTSYAADAYTQLFLLELTADTSIDYTTFDSIYLTGRIRVLAGVFDQMDVVIATPSSASQGIAHLKSISSYQGFDVDNTYALLYNLYTTAADSYNFEYLHNLDTGSGERKLLGKERISIDASAFPEDLGESKILLAFTNSQAVDLATPIVFQYQSYPTTIELNAPPYTVSNRSLEFTCLKEIDISEEVYFRNTGNRLFNDTWGSRRTSTDVIKHPVDVLEHLFRLCQYETLTPPSGGWGSDYPANVGDFIETSTFDDSDLRASTPQEVAYQALTESEASIKEMVNSLAKASWILPYVTPGGKFAVAPMVSASATLPTDKVTYAHLVEEPSNMREPHPGDVFVALAINYKRDFGKGEYQSRMAVGNVEASSYTGDSSTGGYISGFSSGSAAQKELLWTMGRKMYEKNPYIEELPSDMENNPWIHNEQDAYIYLFNWYLWQGCINSDGTASGVSYRPVRRIDITLPFAHAFEWHIGKRFTIQLPHQTDNIETEAMVESLGKNILGNVVKVGAVLYTDDLNIGTGNVRDTMASTTTDWKDSQLTQADDASQENDVKDTY